MQTTLSNGEIDKKELRALLESVEGGLTYMIAYVSRLRARGWGSFPAARGSCPAGGGSGLDERRAPGQERRSRAGAAAGASAGAGAAPRLLPPAIIGAPSRSPLAAW